MPERFRACQSRLVFELLPKQDGERAATYRADFTYWQNGQFVVEDVKGYQSGAAWDLYVLKRKLMLYRFGIKIKEPKEGRDF